MVLKSAYVYAMVVITACQTVDTAFDNLPAPVTLSVASKQNAIGAQRQTSILSLTDRRRGTVF